MKHNKYPEEGKLKQRSQEYAIKVLMDSINTRNKIAVGTSHLSHSCME